MLLLRKVPSLVQEPVMDMKIDSLQKVQPFHSNRRRSLQVMANYESTKYSYHRTRKQ